MGRFVPSTIYTALLLCLVCNAAVSSSASASRSLRQDDDVCAGTEPESHVLLANISTVHWGYVYEGLMPAITIKSGDEITVEMITHQAGHDYAKMIAGDTAVEEIYEWGSSLNIPVRGATGSGDGVHVLTGPIAVCGAEPGDILQVDILDLQPRPNPDGEAYGSNAAGAWGYQFRSGFATGDPEREVVTIYKVVTDEEGTPIFLEPEYQYPWSNEEYPGPVTSCVPPEGTFPRTEEDVSWENADYSYPRGSTVPCINGTQTWDKIVYPGVIVEAPTGTEDESIRGKFKVPMNMHIGNIGLTPSYPTPVHSVPPHRAGGNIDNRRIGAGATMYYPVEVAGGLLTMGDVHGAQGDAELDGTAVEMHANGRFRLTLHKADSLPQIVQDLEFPLLENANEFIVHGFTVNDYLRELEDPGTIFSISNIDDAMTNTVNNARDWLMTAANMTEDQAFTALSTGCDFAITQVVDGNWGVHVSIPKFMLPEFSDSDGGAYSPKVLCGTSMPLDVSMVASDSIGAQG